MRLFEKISKNINIVAELGDVKNNNFLTISLDEIVKTKFDDCEIIETEYSEAKKRLSAIYIRREDGGKYIITPTIHYGFVRGLRSKFNPVDEFPSEKAARIARQDAEKRIEAASKTNAEKAAIAAAEAAAEAERKAAYEKMMADRAAAQAAREANLEKLRREQAARLNAAPTRRKR